MTMMKTRVQLEDLTDYRDRHRPHRKVILAERPSPGWTRTAVVSIALSASLCLFVFFFCIRFRFAGPTLAMSSRSVSRYDA